MNHLSASELATWLCDPARPAPLLLDVREPWEFETARINNATLLPMHEIPARLAEMDPQQAIVCICHHGMRSMQVATFLQRHGYSDLYNLTGGMHAWSLQVDSSIPTY